jgi:hypothetical protein
VNPAGFVPPLAPDFSAALFIAFHELLPAFQGDT